MADPLRQALGLTRDLVEPALRAAVARLDPQMRRVVEYHVGWVGPTGSPEASSAGKGLRPTLALQAALAAGGEAKAAVPAAVAVELVHDFSLVHDDVMDGDELRRHRPTAWVIFGVPAAVLAGDAMLVLAIDVLQQLVPRDLAVATTACVTTAVAELVAGQSADLAFEGRTDVTTDEGLAMAARKTSALLRCSGAAGALAVDASERDVALLGGFGEHLGNAFQLVDDLFGIWGSPDVTGKPALEDLRRRKKSLPVLAALESGTPAGERLRELYARPEPFADAELPGVADLVEQAGGRAWAQDRADAEVALALSRLEALDPPPGPDAALRALARYVTGRER